MTHDEAVNILKNYQLWRRGLPPYDFGQPVNMPFTPEELGEALDYAIAVLNPWPQWVCENHPNKPWGGISDSPDACHCGGAGALREPKPTQFDERVDRVLKSTAATWHANRELVALNGSEPSENIYKLLQDMQAHIKQLEAVK